MTILGLHHAQITIPQGAEEQGRQFYCHLLQLPHQVLLASREARCLRAYANVNTAITAPATINTNATIRRTSNKVRVPPLIPLIASIKIAAINTSNCLSIIVYPRHAEYTKRLLPSRCLTLRL